MASGHTEEDVVRLFTKRPLFEDLGIHPQRPLKDIQKSAYFSSPLEDADVDISPRLDCNQD